MASKVEYRFFEPNDLELRASMENDQMVIEGYAAKYNVRSHLLTERGQSFIEVLEPGTFREHLKEDTYFTFNHSKDKIMAHTRNGSLILTEDEVGLKFRANLNNTTDSKDLYERVSRRDLVENSFCFLPDIKKQKLERISGSEPVKRISGIENLFDISVVTRAAYPNTEVYARELDEMETNEPIKIIDEPYRDMAHILKLKNNQ